MNLCPKIKNLCVPITFPCVACGLADLETVISGAVGVPPTPPPERGENR